MAVTPFQTLILNSIRMGPATGTGYHELICKVCNDHRKRAGFSFQPDGSIKYNCFRGKCDASCGYTPGTPINYKFKRVMDAYGVVIPAQMAAQMSIAAMNATSESYDIQLYKPHVYKNMNLPVTFLNYNPVVHKRAAAYLADREIHDLDYYVSNDSDAWLHVPLRLYDSLIGYQSIKLTEKFYLKSTINTDMIYLPDGEIPEEPVIVEGIMDAKSIPDGIAVLQPTVSPRQAYVLRKRRPILLPDRKGSRFMGVAERYGWPIIIPSWEEKDTNKAVLKYGRIRLAEMMKACIVDDIQSAKLKYEVWTKLK